MSRVKIFLSAGCFGLLGVLPIGAATFHQVYGDSSQPGELTSVASISGAGAIASANFGNNPNQGMLLKVQPTGTLDWVRAYGPTQISAVRELPDGFAWIGTSELPQSQSSAPVVAKV